jgi:YfiH family protein
VLHEEDGSLGPARYAVTDRRGGVSRAPYDALNLGDHVGDDPAAVTANRSRLAAALGLAPGRLAFMRQVHGTTIAVVDGSGADAVVAGPDAAAGRPEADGMVTTERGLGLVVLSADCVPVLLAAPGPHGPVLAAAHAGRKGVQAGVVTEAVAAMRRLGARVEDGQAHVGPAVCGRCYEVPAALQAEVVADVPAAACTTRGGTPGLDLPGAVLGQLVAAGVPDPGRDETCTLETAALYSHRREGVTGRIASVVWVPA